MSSVGGCSSPGWAAAGAVGDPVAGAEAQVDGGVGAQVGVHVVGAALGGGASPDGCAVRGGA
eukprot:4085511-Alexandrium_andersonii.AAC.1